MPTAKSYPYLDEQAALRAVSPSAGDYLVCEVIPGTVNGGGDHLPRRYRD